MTKNKSGGIAIYIILGLMFGIATILWVGTMSTAEQSGDGMKIAGLQMTYALSMGVGGFLGIFSILAFAGAGFVAVGNYSKLLSLGGGKSKRSRW